MGLFDLFKKKESPAAAPVAAKKQSAPVPAPSPAPPAAAVKETTVSPDVVMPQAATTVNSAAVAAAASTLESMLIRASSDPAARPEFYEKLLTERVFVITTEGSEEHKEKTLQQGEQVMIVSLSDGAVPLFSSQERIFDKGVVPGQVAYIEMKGADLFRLTKGARLVLNPFSEYAKELLPDEVERMLDGSIMSPGRQVTLDKDTKVLLGQPTVYPQQLVDALQQLLANKPQIQAAYLAWISMPERNEPPHYIFGIKCTADPLGVPQEMGALANQILGPNELIDIVAIGNGGDTLSDYFAQQTKPFYTRQ